MSVHWFPNPFTELRKPFFLSRLPSSPGTPLCAPPRPPLNPTQQSVRCIVYSPPQVPSSSLTMKTPVRPSPPSTQPHPAVCTLYCVLTTPGPVFLPHHEHPCAPLPALHSTPPSSLYAVSCIHHPRSRLPSSPGTPLCAPPRPPLNPTQQSVRCIVYSPPQVPSSSLTMKIPVRSSPPSTQPHPAVCTLYCVLTTPGPVFLPHHEDPCALLPALHSTPPPSSLYAVLCTHHPPRPPLNPPTQQSVRCIVYSPPQVPSSSLTMKIPVRSSPPSTQPHPAVCTLYCVLTTPGPAFLPHHEDPCALLPALHSTPPPIVCTLQSVRCIVYSPPRVPSSSLTRNTPVRSSPPSTQPLHPAVSTPLFMSMRIFPLLIF
ncbi:uncharacterized protein [Saccopteryx leptura]|uniref:uncharacterized protein n=1 Tax=Saccopteryx leptura TaxID=249018 RepID=UPI00339C13B4